MSDPSRIIPRSLLGGILLVTTLIVLTNAAYFSVLDLYSVTASEATAVTFARTSWGTAGAYLVPIIVCVCTFGTMSSSFLSNSRLMMAAARKRHLPWAFSLITMNSSLPIVAMTCRCCLAILFAVTGSVRFLAKGSMTVFCVMSILVMLSMLRLRVTMKDAHRPIRVPTWLIFVNITISLTVILVPVLAAVVPFEMAGVLCLAILETGERKKLVLPTGAYAELLVALAPFVPINENTLELWKVAQNNKFQNNMKKAVNVSTEMQAVRVQSYYKSSREPVVEVANKKLCRLSDNNDLIFYGEILESRQKQNEWLLDNSLTADAEDLRPRLLATAKERHESLRQITLSEALLQYPFLVTEHLRASDGSLALHIDAQRLFLTSSLLAGLACLFASFWVFHVVYPKGPQDFDIY
ncbi:hypothetical protein HPB49_013711 [Dermacentor silvarum]|uniref:Uncharacterized protein n=1 Tax=Dermacentor silvarum TaxID=543639 RepID=A0ACB8E087_DERSI|nr:hypothetical protein HPB49_013711 [Dermacentor silvarum]